MKSGAIKFYLIKKGYGFITVDDEVDDIFFHHSGLIDKDVKEGNEVEFEIEEGRNGPQAVNIQKL